jgi:adenosylcobinamide-GDP ribazoletransferase
VTLGLALAVSFLSRLPARATAPAATHFARALAWFPTVGALLAALLLGVSLSAGLFTDPAIAAALTLCAWVALTGGLHTDGLADSVDGLAAARGNAARGLEVMRDPRIGAHGAVTLILVLLVKFSLLQHLTGRWLSDPTTLAVVFGTTLASARFWVAQCIVGFPAARSNGLGAQFRAAPSRILAACGALPVLAMLLVLCSSAPWLLMGALVSSAVGGCLVLALSWRWSQTFSGLTGDLYGAGIELGEAATLLSWVVYLSSLRHIELRWLM